MEFDPAFLHDIKTIWQFAQAKTFTLVNHVLICEE